MSAIPSTFQNELFFTRSSRMSNMSDEIFSTLDSATRAHIEIVWTMARKTLDTNMKRIEIPVSIYPILGAAGIEELQLRVSVFFGGAPVVVRCDAKGENIYIMQHVEASDLSDENEYIGTASAELPLSAVNQSTRSTSSTSCRAFGKKSNIPRPPNAFILYRKHWHPLYKQYNNHIHNNEISKELGNKWKSEPEHVKVKYRELAEELKMKHASRYPGYQYAPRKSGEKKRRMTAKTPARLCENQNIRKAPNFLSPALQSVTNSGVSSPIESTSDIRNDQCLTHGLEIQPILYHKNDTYSTTLPNCWDDIQLQIDQVHGQYRLDYVDVIEDVHANEQNPEEHLLHSAPTNSAIDSQNEWEALVDWESVNHAFDLIQHLSSSSEDAKAEYEALLL